MNLIFVLSIATAIYFLGEDRKRKAHWERLNRPAPKLLLPMTKEAWARFAKGIR